MDSTSKLEALDKKAIRDQIVMVLNGHPNKSCVKEQLPKHILSYNGIGARGRHRKQFARRVFKEVRYLCDKHIIEEYVATNVRLRLLMDANGALARLEDNLRRAGLLEQAKANRALNIHDGYSDGITIDDPISEENDYEEDTSPTIDEEEDDLVSTYDIGSKPDLPNERVPIDDVDPGLSSDDEIGNIDEDSSSDFDIDSYLKKEQSGGTRNRDTRADRHETDILNFIHNSYDNRSISAASRSLSSVQVEVELAGISISAKVELKHSANMLSVTIDLENLLPENLNKALSYCSDPFFIGRLCCGISQEPNRYSLRLSIDIQRHSNREILASIDAFIEQSADFMKLGV